MKSSFLIVATLLQLAVINNAFKNTSKKSKFKDIIEADVERSYYKLGGIMSSNPFPFVVSLQYAPHLKHFCSGSIISTRHVITAAHCFCHGNSYKPKEKIIIAAGSEKLAGENTDYYTVADTTCHSHYDPKYQYHDIGILVANKKFKFSYTIAYAPLYEYEIPAQEKEVIIPGWGISSQDDETSRFLHYIEVSTQTKPTCLNLLKESSRFFMDWNICTYNPSKTACSTDTGGPVLLNGRILGIVSWSDGCYQGVPEVHTSIPKHIDWIIKHTSYPYVMI